MNCYLEFAHIYDELINSDIDYKTWCSKMLDLCSEYSVDRNDYLDLACGTGNVTKIMSDYFINNWAVDMSEDMLSEAETKLRKPGKNLKLICQDITKLNLNRKFDLITCCLDSTNYIVNEKDLLSYFEGVRKHLRNNGIFIFDINSDYKLRNILGNNTYTYDSDDCTYIWDNYFEDHVVYMDIIFFVRENDRYKRFDEQHCERAYSEKVIEDNLESAGLKVLKKMDNYTEKTIDKETERITYVVGGIKNE